MSLTKYLRNGIRTVSYTHLGTVYMRFCKQRVITQRAAYVQIVAHSVTLDIGFVYEMCIRDRPATSPWNVPRKLRACTSNISLPFRISTMIAVETVSYTHLQIKPN